MVGVDVETTDQLTSADTFGSYGIYSVTTDGTVPNVFLLSSQASFFVQTAKGNQIYLTDKGLDIGQLNQ
jgi:hypothetical protein